MSLHEMVITSQLLPPDRRRGVLHRRRLEEKLARVLELPLTVVQAGTGYGKTTELASLAGLVPELFWYTISEPERDPLLFLAHLLAAFEQGSRPWGKPFLQRLEETGGKAQPGALTFLLNTLTAGLTRDAVLVLDDYHLVAGVPEVAALVERLVDYRPPRLHIVLSGRQIPAWPALTRWRVKGQVLIVDRTDLAFRVEEIAALFQEQYGLALSPDQATALANETEGWAIALQMIAHQLETSSASLDDIIPSLPSLTEGLPSAMEALFEYLAQEVLSRQPEAVQHFLLATAALRQMSGPSCNALTGKTNGAAMLRRLHDSGLFITSIDAEVYRYQHLFHDFLLASLRQDPEQARALHRRAAAFFQENGNLEESMFHLLEAGDLDEAARQLEALGPALLKVGRLGSLTGWLDRLPQPVMEDHPTLHLLRGDVLRLHAQFDDAIACYQAAERLAIAAGDPLCRSRALRSQAQVYLDTVRPLKANRLLEEALRLLEPQVYPSEVAQLLDQLAENQLNLGQPVQAQTLHQEARLLRAQSDPAEFYLEARALLRTGRLGEAQKLLEEHQEASPDVQRPQRFHRETPLLLSLVCIMQGKVEQAAAYAAQGLAIGKQLESPFVEAVALMRTGHALQVNLMPPWTAAARHQAEEAYLKAIELVRLFKVTRVQVEPLWGLCRLAGYQGHLVEAERYALSAIEIAEQAGDLWFANLIRTAFGASLALARKAPGPEVRVQAPDPQARVQAPASPGSVSIPAGAGKARDWLQAARAGFQQVEDAFGWSAATLWAALDAAWQGDPEAARQFLAELLPVVRERGYAGLLTRCSHVGLKDGQAALPLLLDAARNGLEPVFVNSLLKSLGLADVEYHPGYTLVVRTLGPFEVWRGSTPVTPHDWQREKARQLFQFLLTQRGVWLPREQIVDRLWPHLDADSALQNFKVALNALHRALEPARPAGAAPFFVIRRDNAYMLNPQAHLVLDADDFERAAASSLPEDLRQALAIYEEDFLYDSLGEEWAETGRERLRRLYLSAGERLAEQRLAAGAPEEVLAIAGKLVERDRTWEGAYRWMMRAYAAQGNRAQVQAVFRRCAAVLANELDVDPSPETQALLEALT